MKKCWKTRSVCFRMFFEGWGAVHREMTSYLHEVYLLANIKIFHNHCFYFLLGLTMTQRETGNNAYAKFWREKRRVLWYF